MTDDIHTTPHHRPLGFWLDAVDRLLRREFADALADDELDRADWRLLNALSGDVDAPRLAERLLRKPERVLALAERGWVAPSGSGWELTDEGRAARERIGQKTAAIRERVSAAVPADDFAIMLASLEAIARELGWQEDAPLPPRGRKHGGRGRMHRGRPHRKHERDLFGAWAGLRFAERARARRMAHHGETAHEECGSAAHRRMHAGAPWFEARNFDEHPLPGDRHGRPGFGPRGHGFDHPHSPGFREGGNDEPRDGSARGCEFPHGRGVHHRHHAGRGHGFAPRDAADHGRDGDPRGGADRGDGSPGA